MTMSESFADLFAKEFTEKQLYSGAVVQGQIVKVTKDFVFVNVLKPKSDNKSMFMSKVPKMVPVKPVYHAKKQNVLKLG